MSQRINLEVSDEIYENLRRKASAAGLSTVDWITALLSKQTDPLGTNSLRAKPLGDYRQEAWERLMSHAGSIGSEYETDTDNDSIDADLAKAYANEF